MFVFQRFRHRVRPVIQASATLAVLLGASLLVACAAPGGAPSKVGSGLESWLEQDVYLHLLDQFDRSRLKGQPFIMVAMEGDDTLAEIDALRAWVRDKLRDEFMQTPGLNLVWRPTVKPWRHPRSLADLRCTAAAGGEINVQIGIDAGIDSLSGDLKVSIVAFDLKELSPVTGFSPRPYQGPPSEQERELLKSSKTDEYLRGLRPLPFTGNQGDLLASYLAQNLSCLLSRLPQGRLRLYVPPQGAIPRVFANTFRAIDNYLGQLREVTITDNPRDADVHLQSEITLVDRQQGLYQVWVDVRQTDDSRLGGSQTNAYVRLSAAEAQDIVSIDPHFTPRSDAPAPLPASAAQEPPVLQPIAAPARPPVGAVFRDPLRGGGEGPEMVVLPTGSFQMGSPASEAGRDDDEGPVRTVTISRPIAMGRYEVTFADYDRFVSATGRKSPDDEGWGRGSRPVINVSQADAKAYATWLSDHTGKTYRLPSEAEWEYAARAGTSTRYSWGDVITHEDANYGKDECCGGWASGRDRWVNTALVGSFEPNAFGLFDMHGNVWEWVEDCYVNTYTDAPSDGSARTSGCGSDVRAVVRGGSWNGNPRGLRSANRFGSRPSYRGINYGFRLVQDLNP